jgi:hypothetical protein
VFHVLPALQRGQSHTSLWFASEASHDIHAPFAFPSPSLALAGRRKMSAHRSLRGRNRANIRGQPLRLKETKKMERAKLASGKKTEPTETKHRRLPGNKAERKPKAEKLVCRYCGSDDLAPSFIKRRDRRCRKCFSKRYGSAAPAKKATSKK